MGPLSDRYGRKPVLLIGLTIFALGSLGMLWVENAATLLVLRFVQAVGVCAAAVIWQALVTDYYPSQKVNRILRPSCRWWVYLRPGSSVRKLAAGPFFPAGDFRHPVCHYRGADSAYFLAQTHDEGP